MKEKLRTYIDSICGELCGLSDDIFDHPECGGEERYAVERLTTFLRDQGFTVETGIAGLATAFRAVYQVGTGGPSIGLLCEYDALKGFGHGCGHHMQGPAVLGPRPPCAAVWGRIPRRRSWCTGPRRRRRPWGKPSCCGKGISGTSISR